VELGIPSAVIASASSERVCHGTVDASEALGIIDDDNKNLRPEELTRFISSVVFSGKQIISKYI
jgi:hypothetical protein